MNNNLTKAKEIAKGIYEEYPEEMEESFKLLERFIELKGNIVKDDYWEVDFGLCSNCLLVGATMNLFQYWEHFDGEDEYPISGEEGYWDDDCFPKYQGEQLKLRLSLAQFLLDCFEDVRDNSDISEQ